MSWELVGEVDGLVGPPLGHHDDAADLLHLGVVWGTGAVEVASNLLGQTKTKVNIKKTPCLAAVNISPWMTVLGLSQGCHAYLCPQVRDADELLQDVLGQDVGVARLLDVIRRHVDVVGPQMEVGRRYSPEVRGEETDQSHEKTCKDPNQSQSFPLPL